MLYFSAYKSYPYGFRFIPKYFSFFEQVCHYIFTFGIRIGLIEAWEIPILIVLLAAVLVQLSGNTYNPFIYFRF